MPAVPAIRQNTSAMKLMREFSESRSAPVPSGSAPKDMHRHAAQPRGALCPAGARAPRSRAAAASGGTACRRRSMAWISHRRLGGDRPESRRLQRRAPAPANARIRQQALVARATLGAVGLHHLPLGRSPLSCRSRSASLCTCTAAATCGMPCLKRQPHHRQQEGDQHHRVLRHLRPGDARMPPRKEHTGMPPSPTARRARRRSRSAR